MASILLTRPRLVRRLRQAVRTGHAMLSAPPGYGKSTLLRTFAAEQPNTHYLLLTPDDVDPTYLQARVQPLITAGATLILDDLHHLLDADAALAWLATQARVVKSHFVLSGRQVPNRLHTLLLSQGATHLTITDLAFTRSESQALLGQPMRAAEDCTEDWHTQTQGGPLAPTAAVQAGGALFDYLAETLVAALPPPLVRFMQLTALALS